MKNTKKFALTAALAISAIFAVDAQVDNRALSLPAGASVDCGEMPGLNKLDSYSIQFWMNPGTWTEGATLLSRGDDFSVTLGSKGSVVFNIGGKSFTTTSSSELAEGTWGQVTLSCDKGNATAFVDNVAAGTGSLGSISESSAPFIIGGGTYAGLIDEIRLYNDALSTGDFGHDMETFDNFTFNTLNKWCPMWDNIVAYYKMDQPQYDKHLVEYKVIESNTGWNCHGEFKDGAKLVAANNDKMPYLINSAYTENLRFFDRIIPRDQYLLSNDVIILGADVYAQTGHIETRTPNNHATVGDAVKSVSSLESRTGVVTLDGTANSIITAPAATFPNEDMNYSFETWIYLDEWTPGAYLFRKENENSTKGVALLLGDDPANKSLVLRVNGKKIVSQTVDIPLKTWNHIGIAPGQEGRPISAAAFAINGNSVRPNTSLTDSDYELIPTGVSDIDITVGKNLKASLDETCFWVYPLSAADFKNHMTKIPMRALDGNVTVQDMNKVSAYYRYDDASNLGHSYHSQDEWRNIMMSAYEGRAGVKVFISVNGKYNPDEVHGDWRNILSNDTKRKTFAADLAELSKSYDGVELDLEWIEGGQTQWENYGKLSDEIKKVLPEGKLFRISLHQNYQGFPVDKLDNVDGLTFQQYGPDNGLFSYSTFTRRSPELWNRFSDKSKIMTSYSTTTSNGYVGGQQSKSIQPLGLRLFLDTFTEDDLDKDVNTYVSGGTTFYYMGPLQIYKRAKYTRDQKLQGIFYWDMGNDYWLGTSANPVMPTYNAAKYASYGINANCDTIVSNLPVVHGPTKETEEPGDDTPGGDQGDEEDPTNPPGGDDSGLNDISADALYTIYGNTITFVEPATVFSLSGSLVAEGEQAVLPAGIYVAKVGERSAKFVIR